MSVTSPRIFVVEDEAIIAADLCQRLQKMGFTVVGSASSGERALADVPAAHPDLVLMDIVIKGEINGIETARRLRQQRDVPVVYLTSHADTQTVRAAVGSDPFGYVLKPFNERELQAAIQIALYRHRTEAKLRKMERWMATTLASIGDGVIATDVHGRITLINDVARRLTGWLDDEAIGQPFDTIFRAIDGRTREPLAGLIERALIDGFNIGIDDHVLLQSKAGLEITVDDSVSPIRDEDGAVTGVVVVFRDGTDRKRAEDAIRTMNQRLETRVRQRTDELESANRVLAAFAVSVSHNLQAPLRTVSGFSQLLKERYAASLDAEGRRFLDIVQTQSRQMGGLIDDFLRLSQIRQRALNIGAIDTAALVRKVIAELAPQPTAQAGIEVGELPTMYGDEALLRQVWASLIGNALKFTAKRLVARIAISGEIVGDQVCYSVVDNGIGFDPDKVDELFGMFKRLQRKDEYEGNGVGLAIVAQVVERHGGFIRAEGRPGEGARFEMAFPRVPAILDPALAA